mmetsp:Transcript_9326/g.28797  ORF Transcript_9326/g.28797 Transcript_9326/m.28797 type:complete len:877 (-) Transcript_9326:47-2677(-)|eukprot:CAMPEP_0174235034 /NCGR_PEP_ID=MMETSP0417-20130205/4605_1 /TAXON_ID=242541 /ORGANISM="Mayorella sp, Strain BSH-02190019" /LENGTH=876 /DNA_ID=CAMNT_0015313475 /DNA_START=64 /DNA_END=2694 /DNA_ORIENTATION=-
MSSSHTNTSGSDIDAVYYDALDSFPVGSGALHVSLPLHHQQHQHFTPVSPSNAPSTSHHLSHIDRSLAPHLCECIIGGAQQQSACSCGARSQQCARNPASRLLRQSCDEYDVLDEECLCRDAHAESEVNSPHSSPVLTVASASASASSSCSAVPLSLSGCHSGSSVSAARTVSPSMSIPGSPVHAFSVADSPCTPDALPAESSESESELLRAQLDSLHFKDALADPAHLPLSSPVHSPQWLEQHGLTASHLAALPTRSGSPLADPRYGDDGDEVLSGITTIDHLSSAERSGEVKDDLLQLQLQLSVSPPQARSISAPLSPEGPTGVRESSSRRSRRRSRLSGHHHPPSKHTLLKVATCKASVENYYTELFFFLRARIQRIRQLDRGMRAHKYTEDQKQEKRRELYEMETRYLRSRRRTVTPNTFDVVRVIGRGGFGEVQLVKMDGTEQYYAMKVMQKSRLIRKKQEWHVRSERDALKENTVLQNRNPWVVKLYYSFQDEKRLYLVMEYMPGGDMMHQLFELDVFSMKQTQFYIAELVLAVESIHRLNYVHRDIKPDNILLDINGHIKLSDFGLCTGLETKKLYHFSQAAPKKPYEDHPSMDDDEDDEDEEEDEEDRERLLRTASEGIDRSMESASTASPSASSGSLLHPQSAERGGEATLAPFHNRRKRFRSWKRKRKLLAFSQVGTPDYMAPEVLQDDGYGKQCDWWSVGVIMFEMLSGGAPFASNSPARTRQNVLNYQKILSRGWQREEMERLPDVARDLLNRLLCPVSERLDFEDIVKHPFFEGIDWENIRSQPAEIVPVVESPTDTRNFPADEIAAVPHSGGSDSSDSSPSASMALSTSPLDRARNDHGHFIFFTFRSFADWEEQATGLLDL